MEKIYLNRHDVAAALGKKPNTVSTLVSQRRWDLVPKPLKFQGKYVWRRGDLEEFAAEAVDPFKNEARRRGRPRKGEGRDAA